jgi:hypothetical protein
MTVNLEQPPAVTMAQMIMGGLIVNALHTAAELRIADLVADHPRSPLELAEATGAQSPALARVLRALASCGVFAVAEDGCYTNTRLSDTLRSDIPGSLRPMARGVPVWGPAWMSLLHGVRTGEQPFWHAHGQEIFAYLAAHPEAAATFDTAMSSFSAMEADAVVEAYDFSGIDVLLDVGGSLGFLLEVVLRGNPGMRGILFDQPPVVEHARAALATSDVGGRIQLEANNFFDGLPDSADACILKNILHDFQDEEAIAILRNCRRVLPPHGRVLVVQEALPPGNTPSPGKILDLVMFLIGGRERTPDEYRTLFDASGFRLERIVPTHSPLHVIEGTPL